MTLQPLLMTKHSLFRYIKPDSVIPSHLVRARGPGAKNRGSSGPYSAHRRPITGVACAQVALVSFAWTAVRELVAGVTWPNPKR